MAALALPFVDRAPPPKVIASRPGILQRCGDHPCPSTGCTGSCADEDRLQRFGLGGLSTSRAPHIVHDVLKSPGHPLDSATRAFAEPRLGHHFGNVRIHADALAAQSARAVDALAYTVGEDIVFGAQRYEPRTAAGRRLLAHELAHVVQQGAPGASRSSTLDVLEVSQPSDQAEIEADRLADRALSPRAARHGVARDAPDPREPRIRRAAAASEGTAEITGETEERGEVLDKPSGGTGTIGCQTLSFADFKGSVPTGATKAADTEYDYTPKTIKAGDTVTAVFDGKSSWAQARYANPTDRKATGLDKAVADCEDHLKKNPGASWDGPSPTVPICAAAAPFPNTTGITAVSDCDPKIGVAIEKWQTGESPRVLKHEQFHMNLACTLADKATKALAAGRNPATVGTRLMAQDRSARGQYDTDTSHGCKAADQMKWESFITGGLTAYPVP